MSFHFKASLTCATAATAAIFLSSATPALAGTDPVIVTAPRDDERLTRVVSYRDLDLALIRDQRRLDRRLHGAIEYVCQLDEYHVARTLAAYAPYRACSNVAWTEVRAAKAAAVALAQAGPGAGGIRVASTAITISARVGE